MGLEEGLKKLNFGIAALAFVPLLVLTWLYLFLVPDSQPLGMVVSSFVFFLVALIVYEGYK